MVTKKKQKASKKKDETILEKVVHLFTNDDKPVKRARATVAASVRKQKKAPAKPTKAASKPRAKKKARKKV